MGTVNLTTEEYDALKKGNQEYVGQWRDLAMVMERRIAELETITSHGPVSLTQAEYIPLKAYALLGQQICKMAPGTDLARTPTGWQVCNSASSSVIASGTTPGDALSAGGVAP